MQIALAPAVLDALTPASRRIGLGEIRWADDRANLLLRREHIGCGEPTDWTVVGTPFDSR
jgi:hypothetical protein